MGLFDMFRRDEEIEITRSALDEANDPSGNDDAITGLIKQLTGVGIEGVSKFSGAKEIADKALAKANGDVEAAVDDVVRQHLVGAITDEHLGGAHAVIIGHRLLEAITVGVRVQAQAVAQLGLHGGDRLGRRAIGVLVGVELDQLGQFRLLTRHVGHQVLDEGAPELAHLPFSPRIRSVCVGWKTAKRFPPGLAVDKQSVVHPTKALSS